MRRGDHDLQPEEDPPRWAFLQGLGVKAEARPGGVAGAGESQLCEVYRRQPANSCPGNQLSGYGSSLLSPPETVSYSPLPHDGHGGRCLVELKTMTTSNLFTACLLCVRLDLLVGGQDGPAVNRLNRERVVSAKRKGHQ